MTGAVVPLRPAQQPDAAAPPHNLEVEQALLGALMVWPTAYDAVAATLLPEHFFYADHQEIYVVVQRLAAAGAAATAPAVKGYLAQAEIDGMPTMAYLAHLARVAAVVSGVTGFAAIVRDFAQRRRLVAIGEELASRARHDPIDESGMVGAGLIDDADTALIEARAEVPDTHLAGMTGGEGAAWMLDRVRDLRSGTLASTAVASGLAELDRVTNGGFHRGQLYLMAGRPGMGKTVAMTSMSRYAARDAGVLVFQLEVTRDQQFARYLSDLSYVHNRPLSFGQIMAGVGIDDEDMWRLEDAQKRLSTLHLKVECEPSITIAALAHKVKAEKKRQAARGVSLGVVFIDYLKYIKVSDRYAGQRVLEIGEIAGALKQLAKREDICIVLLAQLNRGVEAKERADRRPTVSDLRDSGELEEAADCVLLLYRDAFYLQKKLRGGGDPEIAARLIEKQHSLEIILGKNRSGPECTLDLWCDVAASTIAQHARGPA